MTMNRWQASESIFAPIVTALPPGTHWSGFGNAIIAASGCVPDTAIVYRMKRPGTFKAVNEIRRRSLLCVTGENAAPFSARVSLLDRPPGRQVPNLAGIRLWEVGMTWLKKGLCTPAVPEDFDTAILQVSKFQITQRGLAGGPQLALLRHLWAEAVLAASGEAIVFGGQYHWQDSWWTEKIMETEEAR